MRFSLFSASLAVSLALFLSGCGSVFNGPTQKVTLLTPGADHAVCKLHNKDFQYDIVTGETRTIMRSEYDLIVDCDAPGNRQKSIMVERTVTQAGVANITTAGVGALYDYYENALFEYPPVITVDFRDVPPKSYGLPEHHAPDIPHPSTVPVTHRGPTTPKIEADRYTPVHVLQKKDMSYLRDDTFSAPAAPVEPVMSAPAVSTASPSPLPPSNTGPANIKPSKSGTTADELTRSMNPQVFQ